jgi:RNA polymerase sigma factor (sigma-70 family)
MAQLDWTAIREVLRRTLASKMDRHEPALLDDLVQEGCVRFLRSSRREAVDDVTGLAIVIAQRTWLDYLRRVSRYRKHFTELNDATAERVADSQGSADPLLGDPRERLGLIVQQALERRGAEECQKLAEAFLARLDWRQVATSMNVGYAAVRKRWSRCLNVLREEISSDPEWSAVLGEA